MEKKFALIRMRYQIMIMASALCQVASAQTTVIVPELGNLPRDFPVCEGPAYFLKSGLFGRDGTREPILSGTVAVNSVADVCVEVPENLFVLGAKCTAQSIGQPRIRCQCELGTSCCDGLVTVSNLRVEHASQAAKKLCVTVQALDFNRQDFAFDISPVWYKK